MSDDDDEPGPFEPAKEFMGELFGGAVDAADAKQAADDAFAEDVEAWLDDGTVPGRISQDKIDATQEAWDEAPDPDWTSEAGGE